MQHRSARFLLASLALAAAACAARPPDGTSAAEPIVAGTVDNADDAVVYIQGLSGFYACTGTLISPHVVLTAKHCVQGSGMSAPYAPSTFRIGVGTHFGFRSGGTPTIRVHRAYTTPGVYYADPTTGLSGAIEGIDIGLLTLDTPPAGVTPIPIRRDPPLDRIGLPYTAIGFGQTDTGDVGTKYVVVNHTGVTSVMGGVLYSSRTICSGDSGGPMLQEDPFRQVIGVASFGQADSCPSDLDGHNRVDVELPLIDRATIEAGDCVNTGTEVCNSIDDNCDGTIDEGCTPPGSPCTMDSDCAFAQLPSFLDPLPHPSVCLDTGHGPICTRTCDPIHGAADQCSSIAHPYHAPDTTTWDGASCVTTSDCAGVCEIAVRGALGNDAPCAADTDCASLHCADPGDRTRRCLTACTGDDADCPLGEACAAPAGACGSCVAAGELLSPHGYGEPCTTGADCVSGTCAMSDPEPFCTRTCTADTDCGADFHCVSSGTCARGARGPVGAPCVTNEDCQGGAFCATGAGHSWCTTFCSSDATCPMHFGCQAAGGAMICVPTATLAGGPCTTDADCASGLCRSGVCTVDCAAGARCGAGLYCLRDDAGVASSCLPAPPPPVVTPPKGGCCAVAGTAASEHGALALLVGLALVVARRRRR